MMGKDNNSGYDMNKDSASLEEKISNVDEVPVRKFAPPPRAGEEAASSSGIVDLRGDSASEQHEEEKGGGERYSESEQSIGAGRVASGAASDTELLQEKYKDELQNMRDTPSYAGSTARRPTVAASGAESSSRRDLIQPRRAAPDVPGGGDSEVDAQQQSGADSHGGEATVAVEPYKPWPAAKLISFAARIRQQSARWLALSCSLWNLVIMDAQRVVNDREVEALLEALTWRAQGKISGPELSVILHEWMVDTASENSGILSPSGGKLIGAPLGAVGGGAAGGLANPSKKARQQSFSLFHLRVVLVNKAYQENDIDLLIGIVVNECNSDLLGKPVSFHGSLPSKESRKKKSKKRSKDKEMTRLEVVSERWLSLSEELFFVLDNSGYGYLRFDELFFLASCLCLGLHGWHTLEELHDDLSMGVIVAYAVQLQKELGCVVPTTAFKQLGLAMTLKSNVTDEMGGGTTGDEGSKVSSSKGTPKPVTTSAAIADESLPTAAVVALPNKNKAAAAAAVAAMEDTPNRGRQAITTDDSDEESYTIHEQDWNHSTKHSKPKHVIRLSSPTSKRENTVKTRKSVAASSSGFARRGSILGNKPQSKPQTAFSDSNLGNNATPARTTGGGGALSTSPDSPDAPSVGGFTRSVQRRGRGYSPAKARMMMRPSMSPSPTRNSAAGANTSSRQNRNLLPFARHIVTLTAFKTWLVGKGCNEDLLSSLLEHVKVVVGRMRRNIKRDSSSSATARRKAQQEKAGGGSKGGKTVRPGASPKAKVRIALEEGNDGNGEGLSSDEEESTSDEEDEGGGGGDGDSTRSLGPQALAKRRVLQSMSSLEDATTLGAPKLWQFAVLAASGISSARYRESIAARNEASPVTADVPSVVHYLMVDGEKYVPAAWRASEEGCKPESDSEEDSDEEDDEEDEDDSPGAGISVLSREDEEEECAIRLYHQHKAWESNAGIASSASASAAGTSAVAAAAEAARKKKNAKNYLDTPDSEDGDSNSEDSGADTGDRFARQNYYDKKKKEAARPSHAIGPAAQAAARGRGVVRDPDTDPIMHLIRAALRIYKESMGVFCRSLRGYASTYLPPSVAPGVSVNGNSDGGEDAAVVFQSKSSASRVMNKACALLLPEIEDVLFELGLDVDEQTYRVLEQEQREEREKREARRAEKEAKAHAEQQALYEHHMAAHNHAQQEAIAAHTAHAAAVAASQDSDNSEYDFHAAEDEVSVASSLLGQHGHPEGLSHDPLGIFGDEAGGGKGGGTRKGGRGSVAYQAYKEQQKHHNAAAAAAAGGGGKKGAKGQEWTHITGDPHTSEGKKGDKKKNKKGKGSPPQNGKRASIDTNGQYTGASNRKQAAVHLHTSTEDDDNDDDDDDTEVSEWDDGLNMFVRVARPRQEQMRQGHIQQQQPFATASMNQQQHDSSGSRERRDTMPDQTFDAGEGGNFHGLKRYSQRNPVPAIAAADPPKKKNILHFFQKLPRKMGISKRQQKQQEARRRSSTNVADAAISEGEEEDNMEDYDDEGVDEGLGDNNLGGPEDNDYQDHHQQQTSPRHSMGGGGSAVTRRSTAMALLGEAPTNSQQQSSSVPAQVQVRSNNSSFSNLSALDPASPGSRGGSVHFSGDERDGNGAVNLGSEEAAVFSKLLAEGDHNEQRRLVSQLQQLRGGGCAGGSRAGSESGGSRTSMNSRQSLGGGRKSVKPEPKLQLAGAVPQRKSGARARASTAPLVGGRAPSPRTSFITTTFFGESPAPAAADPTAHQPVNFSETEDENEQDGNGVDSDDGRNMTGMKYQQQLQRYQREAAADNMSGLEEDDLQSYSSAGNDSTGATSITEMLQQGQSAGKYAQTLREILRNMDKGDKNYKLESLEEVLRLGHAIAQKEKASEGGSEGNNGSGNNGERNTPGGAGAQRPPLPPNSSQSRPRSPPAAPFGSSTSSGRDPRGRTPSGVAGDSSAPLPPSGRRNRGLSPPVTQERSMPAKNSARSSHVTPPPAPQYNPGASGGGYGSSSSQRSNSRGRSVPRSVNGRFQHPSGWNNNTRLEDVPGVAVPRTARASSPRMVYGHYSPPSGEKKTNQKTRQQQGGGDIYNNSNGNTPKYASASDSNSNAGYSSYGQPRSGITSVGSGGGSRSNNNFTHFAGGMPTPQVAAPRLSRSAVPGTTRGSVKPRR
jgi:hypothetical protein